MITEDFLDEILRWSFQLIREEFFDIQHSNGTNVDKAKQPMLFSVVVLHLAEGLAGLCVTLLPLVVTAFLRLRGACVSFSPFRRPLCLLAFAFRPGRQQDFLDC